MGQYSEEMGFIAVEDDSKLHIRQLGGYPQMSFAFRYLLPKKKRYKLHIGSGAIDPDTGYPPERVGSRFISDEAQGTLIVSLQKMPTRKGVRWTIQCIDGATLDSSVCDDEFEFTWLQTYLAAFPTDDQVGHGVVDVIEPDQDVVLYRRGEFHPSALNSLTDEMRRDRETFMIWLEPIANDALLEAVQGSGVAN